MDGDNERILHVERITGEALARVFAGESDASEVSLTFAGRSVRDGWVVASHTFVLEEGRASGILTAVLERRGDYEKGWGF